MHIKKIRMVEYKRFHDLTIDLGDNPKRIVALVGPNGCGKSSVFDAMLFSVSGWIRVGNNSTHKDFHYHSLVQNSACNYANIEIEFNNGKFAEVFHQKKPEQKTSMFSFRSAFRFNSQLEIKETKSVGEILTNNYGASSASDTDQRIEQSYRRLLAKYNQYLNEKNVRPSEAKSHIIGELNIAIKNCLDLEINSIGSVEENKGTLYFKKSDSDIIFAYNVLSAGEKEVIDILLDLYLRKNSYTDSIYIIDEPELHLNTAIQRSLLLEIDKMIPENCQIWLATHSIGFLRALQDELKAKSQIIEFKSENKWASETYTLTPAVASRSMWQNVFSTALDDLTNLVSPKTIIYCEGDAKPTTDGSEKGLDAQVFNIVFAEKYPDTLFVSSGGNTELDQRSDIAIAILSKALPTLEILILKDRDMGSGKEVTEADRQKYFDNNPESHRLLKRFEIENYLYDKTVLSAYCESEGLEFKQAKYDGHVQDIVNHNLKDDKDFIKSCCSIVGSINEKKFKLNLAQYIKASDEVFTELEDVIFHGK